MNENRCLYCYKEFSEDQEKKPESSLGYHSRCSKKIFGSEIPPELTYSEEDMFELAESIIKSHKTVTGVQPKLSLGIDKTADRTVPSRFTIVGLWGEYILKPPTKSYRSLPELEDLTMHLATIAKIKTVDHSLIFLKSGKLAYITKRVDRKKGKKVHMEDMCQLTERLTEHKYKGSYEQIAKAILKYAANPGLDVINFYELVIFCFLTGNNDMHLKNFSLLKDEQLSYHLCPAYDLIASELVVEGDDEELALTLNGKKKKLKRKDFVKAMERAGINAKVMSNLFNKFNKLIPKWHSFIDQSFLSDDLKKSYCQLIEEKALQIEINKRGVE
ncbi:HipA domain-containing protein [Rapidithrix thailandica]|uniref:HipA domain-containing protein n=1 Tax=Rapidithrix thailandica TaxID=413964 RepID=A0AAW9S3P3_9BACT